MDQKTEVDQEIDEVLGLINKELTTTDTKEITKKEELSSFDNLATKIMDRQLFKGKKKVATQELQFPRCYRNYPWPEEIAETQTGWYCELCVHQRVKDACCEEALALLVRGNSPRLKLQREGVQSFSVDGLSETYQAGFGKGLLSQEAKELLKPYLAKAVSITC